MDEPKPEISDNPTPVEIIDHVQNALNRRELKNAFGVSLIPAHAHTGTDSSQIAAENLSLSTLTTNNVNSTRHGLAPVSPADATKFLNGATAPDYAQVKDSDLSTSDITTNNVSTSKHGFAPKLPNDATKYLDGTGAYTTPTSITALTLVPSANFLTNGVALQNPGINYNTTLLIGQVYIPAKITANKISWYCKVSTVAGTVKLVLYSEDGQTQIFSVTTASVSAGVITTALSSVVINPGVYWIGFLVVGAATNIQWENYNSGGVDIENLWNSVTGKPVLEGFLTVTADTIPATITPTAISNSGNSVLISRLDN